MTGLNGHRVYLDWNATAPLRPEARAAMMEAMDLVGNPSSVHAEGRAAKAVVEKARGQVAALVGCEPSEVVFTSGATEAAAIVANSGDKIFTSNTAHECLFRWAPENSIHPFFDDGHINWAIQAPDEGEITLSEIANGETGIRLNPFFISDDDGRRVYAKMRDTTAEYAEGCILLDATQWIGKHRLSLKEARVAWGSNALCMSAHKLGGPKGVGALLLLAPFEIRPLLKGGGQEQGRRSGTENVIGIAGFGAAAEAAQRDLEAGVWDRVEKLRDALEDRLAEAAPEITIFGKDAPRLPNTSCFAIHGWSGEMQVMQMDLSGFAISAGSACSSGKVGPSRVILAMTGDEELARSAIRVSMGPTTTEEEVMAFADAWIEHYRRRREKAA